ncbi:MAG TPA: glycosyltransferase [Gaiellaceae bacterium]|nr:glycosyltransferase [Gaiellaceae bacterium]
MTGAPTNPRAPSPHISVIVPARNAANSVGDLLAALATQTLPRDQFEVLVVDDGSVDETAALVEAWVERDRSRRRLLRGAGRGPAHARNLALAHARGEWVAFTDADTLPRRDWLEAGLATLERTGAQALEGAVDPWPDLEPLPHHHYVSNRLGGRYLTANMVYRRELLERVGGFDEEFPDAFLEDSDLAFRVLDLGVEIPFAPGMRVRHPVRDVALRDALRAVERVRSLPLLAEKHPRRYHELRPVVRPVSSVDVDLLLALPAAGAAARARGLGRLVLLGVAAKGVRSALLAGRVLAGPREEMLVRAALSLALPPLRAWWWLLACARSRRVV